MSVLDKIQTDLNWHICQNPQVLSAFSLSRPNIKPEWLEQNGIGYCDNNNATDIVDKLRKDYTLDQLINWGIVSKKQVEEYEKAEQYIPPSQRHYEFALKDRVTFPLMGEDGEIQSFFGRTTVNSPAKWKNLTNSELFQRSQSFYPLHLFKPIFRSVILVEGYMDALCLQGYGYNTALSIFGIQMTELQAYILNGLGVQDYHIMLDGDLSGQIGMLKTILSIKAQNYKSSIFIIDSKGKDPDEFTKEEFDEAFISGVKLEEEAEPLGVIQVILDSIDRYDHKHCNVMNNGGWRTVLDFVEYFDYLYLVDIKKQIRDKFGKNINLKRQDLNWSYRNG